MPYILKN
jgi:hypothetical protein